MGCVCLIEGGGASTPLVERWWREHVNKLVEDEVFIDSVC